ncbi:MAG: Crp/Fnr family transcriptional regulator [Caldilinea sp.]
MANIKPRCEGDPVGGPETHPDLYACVAANPVFAGLSQPALLDVLGAARLRSVPVGGAIVRQGDEAGMFGVIFSGRAKMVQVTQDGRQVLLRYIVSDQEFGLIAALHGFTYPLTLEAVEVCQVLCWPGARLAEFFARYPQVPLNALHIMVIRNQELQARYRELLTDRVEQRLARALLRLASIAGEDVEAGRLITLSLTRESLAELIGATLYTVSRTLSQWEQAGHVQSRRERIMLRRPAALEQLAGEVDELTQACLAPCALAELMVTRRHVLA